MNEISNVKISVGPLTAFNALIGAKVRGKHFSDTTEGLSWTMASSFEDPDTAPRGQNNPKYTAGIFLQDMDPTCALGIASALGTFRNDLPSVAYTRHIAGMQAMTALSPQLAGFWKEYSILAQKAILAEKAIRSASVDQVDEYRDVRYSDGAITEFLIATGDIYGTELNMPEYDTINVGLIYERVKDMMTPYLKSLDIKSFKLESDNLSQTMGIGTTPGTGSSLAVLSAATFDMLRNPWTRILRNPAAYKICRPYLISRLEAILSSPTLEEAGKGEESLFDLVESVGVLQLMINPALDAGVNADNLHQYAMSLPALTTAQYQQDKMYTIDGQFYNIGDLVESIFVSGSVDPLEASCLAVMLDELALEEYEWNGAVRKALVVGNASRGKYNSGPLCSISPVSKTTINVLCGTTIAKYNLSGTAFGELSPNDRESQAGLISYPNGTLDMSCVANTTALSWYRFLVYLADSLPNDLRILMERTGRGMKTLPGLRMTSLRDTSSVMTGMVTSGVRDGLLAPINLSFNIIRPGRSEQEGPLLANTTWTEEYPQGGVTSTCLVTRAGNWDTVEDTSSMAFINPFGSTVRIDALPSRFVGSWDAGRYTTYLPGVLQASGVSGPNVPLAVASNLCIWPGTSDANGNYVPMTLIEGDGYDSTFKTLADQLDSLTALPEFYAATFGDYDGLTEWENQHPIHGFVRGLAAYTPGQVYDDGDPDAGRIKNSASQRNRAIRAPLGPDFSAVYKSRSQSSSVDMSSVHHSSVIDDGKMAISIEEDIKDIVGTFYMKHLWDINRINCIGLGNYRWKGTGIVPKTHNFCLPHPYAREPIAVHTWVMTLEDINTAANEITNIERRVHAYMVDSSPEDAIPYGEYPVPILGATTYAHDAAEGRVESLDGCESGVYSIGGSDRWPARISGSLMTLGPLNGGVPAAAGSVFDPTAGAGFSGKVTDLQAFNPIQASFVLDNGIGSTVNLFSTRTYNPTDKVDLFGAAWPVLDDFFKFVVPGPFRVEGETLATVGDGNKNEDYYPRTVLFVDGIGFSSRDSFITADLLSVSPWLQQSYTTLDRGMPSTFIGPIPPANQVGNYSMVVSGVRNSKVGGSQASWANQVVTWRGPYALTSVTNNEWFTNGNKLSLLEERARRETLKNPWIRGEGESGLLHTRYEPSDIAPITRQTQARMLAISKMMTDGLTTSLFMELQIAN